MNLIFPMFYTGKLDIKMTPEIINFPLNFIYLASATTKTMMAMKNPY